MTHERFNAWLSTAVLVIGFGAFGAIGFMAITSFVFDVAELVYKPAPAASGVAPNSEAPWCSPACCQALADERCRETCGGKRCVAEEPWCYNPEERRKQLAEPEP